MSQRSLTGSKTVKQIFRESRNSVEASLYQQCSSCGKVYHICKTTIYQAMNFCFKCASKNPLIMEAWAKRIILPADMLLNAVNVMKWQEEEITNRKEMRILLETMAEKKICEVCKTKE